MHEDYVNHHPGRFCRIASTDEDSVWGFFEPGSLLTVIHLRHEDPRYDIVLQHESVHAHHALDTQWGFADSQLAAGQLTHFRELLRRIPQLRVMIKYDHYFPPIEELAEMAVHCGVEACTSLLKIVHCHRLRRTLSEPGGSGWSLGETAWGWHHLAVRDWEVSSGMSPVDQFGHDVQTYYTEIIDRASRSFPILKADESRGTFERKLGLLPAEHTHLFDVGYPPVELNAGRYLTAEDLSECAAALIEYNVASGSELQIDALQLLLSEGTKYSYALEVFLSVVNPSAMSPWAFLCIVEVALAAPMCASIMKHSHLTSSLLDLLPSHRFVRACQATWGVSCPAPTAAPEQLVSFMDDICTQCSWPGLTDIGARVRQERSKWRHDEKYQMALGNCRLFTREEFEQCNSAIRLALDLWPSLEYTHPFCRFLIFLERAGSFASNSETLTESMHGGATKCGDALVADGAPPSLLLPGVVVADGADTISMPTSFPLAIFGLCSVYVERAIAWGMVPSLQQLQIELTRKFCTPPDFFERVIDEILDLSVTDDAYSFAKNIYGAHDPKTMDALWTLVSKEAAFGEVSRMSAFYKFTLVESLNSDAGFWTKALKASLQVCERYEAEMGSKSVEIRDRKIDLRNYLSQVLDESRRDIRNLSQNETIAMLDVFNQLNQQLIGEFSLEPEQKEALLTELLAGLKAAEKFWFEESKVENFDVEEYVVLSERVLTTARQADVCAPDFVFFICMKRVLVLTEHNTMLSSNDGNLQETVQACKALISASGEGNHLIELMVEFSVMFAEICRRTPDNECMADANSLILEMIEYVGSKDELRQRLEHGLERLKPQKPT